MSDSIDPLAPEDASAQDRHGDRGFDRCLAQFSENSNAGRERLEVDASGSSGEWLARYHLAAIVESAEDAIISKNLDGVIQSWNPGAEKMFGYTAAEMINQPMLRLLPKGCEDEELTILARLRGGERICNFITTRRHKEGRLIRVSLTISPVRDDRGRIIGASKIARDVTPEFEQMIAQNALIDRLQNALAEIKALRGLLPICMHCKKIRDDQGFWQQMEAYFHAHTNVEFSHGLCPECLNRHYEGVDKFGRV